MAQAGTSKKWYYSRNGERFGPCSMDQLEELAQSGELATTDLLWSEGMSEWKPAGHSRKLFPDGEMLQSGSDPEMDYAGFWIRVAATLLDIILFWFVQLVIGGFAFFYMIFHFANVEIPKDMDPQKAQEVMEAIGMIMIVLTWLFVQFAMLMFQWLYYSIMECSSAQGSLGKLAVRIKVTDLNGERISFGRASGRFFGKILSFSLLGIGILMSAFTNRKQGLHDIMSGCLVVMK